jgi:hypothetical protein
MSATTKWTHRYDAASSTLTVNFEGGRRHDFLDVSHPLYLEMVATERPLDHFNLHIWNKFEHRTHWQNVEDLLQYIGEHFTYEAPVTPQSRAGDDDTPLHLACVWGDVTAVELLLSAGAEPDPSGDLGTTPLYNAVSFEHLRCADRLLKAGASPDAKNELNSTPRKRALESNNPKLVALFATAA